MANHLQIPNDLYEAISAVGLSMNERRVVDLIIRCSLGCRKEKALLIQRDFTVTGMKESHVGEVIERLFARNIIFRDKATGHFWVNTKLPETVSYESPRFTEILSKNLREQGGRTYEKGKVKLPISESHDTEYGLPINKIALDKDSKENINTTKTSSEYKQIIKFLLSREDIRKPEAFLDSIISKYGKDCLPYLTTLEFSRWTTQLEYLKQVGKI